MSREIKFRVWDKKNNKYRELGVYDIANGKVVVRFPIETLLKGDYILEQYTGLTDKNGKEIYEGDIITETIDDGSNKIIQMYEVYWDIDTLCWYIKGVKGFDYNLHDELWQTNSSREIIGNIHENGELIGGEE